MRIDLRTVKKETQLFRENIDTDIPEVKGQPEACVEIRRISGGFEVKGNVSGIFILNCSKCLREYEKPFETDFRLVFREAVKYGNNEAGKETGELDVASFEGDKLDLTENIRGEILLELPAKPICGDDCKGLCPVCGQNLNEGDCGCAEKSVNPAMSELKKIKEQLYGGE